MFTQILENALCEAIVKHDLEAATRLIELIKKHETASLFEINDNNENFLHIALKQKATDIFKLLYASVKNGERAKSYLSRPDCDGNSLFQLALHLDTPNEATTLFNDFAQTYSLDESIKVFFRSNKEGNTPLHFAACEEKSESFAFIMNQISKADGSDKQSNQDFSETQVRSAFFISKNTPKAVKPLKSVGQVNNKGESALHLAASKGCISNAIHLINAGFSPFLKNVKGETALDLLAKQFDNKLNPLLPAVFSACNPKIKQDILVYYRNKLLADSDNEQLKNMYFALASRISLVVLCNAHLEFNKTIPIKTGLPAKILFWEEMPDSYRRESLKAEKKDINIKRQDGEFTPDMIKQLKKEALIDLLIELERALEGVKTRCETLDKEPSFKASFNNSSFKSWIDDDSVVGGSIGCSAVVGGLLGLLIGTVLMIVVIFTSTMAPWLIPVVLFGSAIGGMLLAILGATLFFGVLKLIDLLCHNPSNNSVDLSSEVTDTLNQIKTLSSAENWLEAVTSPLKGLIDMIKTKDAINVKDATLFTQCTQRLIEELPTVTFYAKEVVKIDSVQERVVEDESVEDKKSLQII